MRRLARLWPAAASALALTLAFPPFDLGFLVFVALVPWLLWLRGTTPRGAFRRGYALGFLFSLYGLFWFHTLTTAHTGRPWLALVPWLLSCAIMALYYGLIGWLAHLGLSRGMAWTVPLTWTGVEVARAYIPVFAFPWDLLGTPLWPYPALIQSAHYGTLFLCSAWAVAVNVLIASLIAKEPAARMRPLAAAVAGVLALSLIRWWMPAPPSDRRTISVGQPGVDVAFGGRNAQTVGVARSVTHLIAEARARRTNLLVLPEGLVRGGAQIPPRTLFDVDTQVPILFGGQRGEGTVYQSAYAYDGNWGYADKTRLVIFGEFVPGRSWIPGLASFNLPAGDLSASQEGVKTLDVAGMRVGPVVCFEALFSDIPYRQAKDGARLLAVISIDDWFMNSNAPAQLRAASIWRAVETGLPLVRSATQGHTLAVDGKGRVLAEAPLKVLKALHVELNLPRDPQGFAPQPLFPALCLLAIPIVPLLARRKRL